MKEWGGVSWAGVCHLLLRKYGLEDYEMGSVQEWKERVHSINSRDWLEEVEGKSSLSWYRMVKEGAGLEQYTRSSVGHEELRLRFRLRTGSAGLLEDKKRCKMCTDDRCVLCDSGEVEDVKHFLVRCEEFSWERWRLLERIGITRVVRGVLEGRGRRKDGFAARKEHSGRSSYEFDMDNVLYNLETLGAQ